MTIRTLLDFEIMGLSILRYQVSDYMEDLIREQDSVETNYNRVYKVLSNNVIYNDYINNINALSRCWKVSRNGNFYLTYENNNITLFDNIDSYAFIINGMGIDMYKGEKLSILNLQKKVC